MAYEVFVGDSYVSTTSSLALACGDARTQATQHPGVQSTVKQQHVDGMLEVARYRFVNGKLSRWVL